MSRSTTALASTCQDDVRRQAASDLTLTVSISRREIAVNRKRIELGPREMVVMVSLAKHCLQGKAPIGNDHRAIEEWINPVREEIARHLQSGGQGIDNLGAVMDDCAFRRVLSDIRKRLRAAGCHALVEFLPRGRSVQKLDYNGDC